MNVPVLISRSCKLNNNDKFTCSKPIARDNCFSLIIMSEILHTFEAEQNSIGPVHSHLHRKGFQLEEIKIKTVGENTKSGRRERTIDFFSETLRKFLTFPRK